MMVILSDKIWNNTILDPVFSRGGIYWFIYSFNKYLLNVCSLLGMILGTGSTVNKTDKNPCPRGGHSMVGGD